MVQDDAVSDLETSQKSFEREEMTKKMLTTESYGCYAEGLKLVIPAFAPVRFANFLYLPMARMRAENNQYQPSLYYSFSESSPPSYLAVLSKKVIQMTNTTIQNLLNILETELGSIYRSARVKPATNNSMDSYFALSEKQKKRIKQLCRRHLVLQTRLSKITEE